VANLTANTAANLVLSTADGSKFYIVSNSGANTILATDSTFSTPRVVQSLGVQPTSALITPDGRRLLVGAGTLLIIDTASDSSLVAGGLNVMGAVIDVAVNMESTKAFALVNTGSGTQLTAVDLSTNSVIGSIPVPGFATGVSTGPNNLLYVTNQNVILEVDPRSFAIRQQIQLNARPGKMFFTPDGKLGVAVNSTPITGNILVVLDLNTRMLGVGVPTASLPANVILDKILIPSSNRILAFSSGAQTLFDITLAPVSVNAFSFSTAGAVSAVGLGTDIATAAHPSTQYLFIASGTTLNRVDLPGNQLSGQASLGNAAGAISVTGAAATGTPTNILTIGDNQNVPLGSTSLPIVVRLTNGLGQPLARVPVTFTTTAAGAPLQPASTTTNNDGFAATSISGISTGGIFNVVAAAGGLTATFTLSSGTIGGVAGGLTIVSGQGQLLFEQSTTAVGGAQLGVVLKDTTGAPVPNADITFTLTTGNGTLVGGTSSSATVTDVITDANGMAAIDFLTTNITAFPGYLTSTVVASTTGSATATFYVSTASARTASGGLSAPTIQLIKPDLGTVLTGQAGQTLKGAVQAQIVSASGQPIPFVSLRFLNQADPTKTPPVTCAGGFALSDNTGTATCDAVLGGALGTVQVTPNVGYLQTLRPISFNITKGIPGAIRIVQGDKQAGKPGDKLPLPLVVEVSDGFGNILPQAPVTWAVPVAGTAILSDVISTTDQVGKASAVVTLGNTTGLVKITVTTGSITQTFTLTSLVPVAGLQYVSGNAQSTLVNTPFPSALVVKLVDNSGNGVAGVTINFALLSGNAVVSNSNPTTDAQGNAATTVTAGGTSGPVTIAAS
jgi:adhesin/invasin